MKATRWLGLAVSAGVLGGTLGCAQTMPAASTQAPAVIPQAQSVPGGDMTPDSLLNNDRQIMVDGKAMTFDQIRKELPARISEADAAKMLVKLNPNEVVADGNEQNVQQWRGRFFGRRFFGRGFSPFFFNRFSTFSYFPYSSFYFPYYYNAGYYYPYVYPYYSYSYYPFFYRYGARYWPYSYWW